MRARTIADLARLAGVTPGTVSRALANKSVVSAKTRERIQSLAREHDFHVNVMARNLRTRRTSIIGVVIPLGHDRRQHISDPFFMMMLGHLADSLTESGYDIMLSRIIPDADDWLERIVESGMLEGVLLIGQSDQSLAIERVGARYRPMVVWGGHSEGQGYCSVGTDNRAGGALAARHLIDRGCRRLCFLGDIAAPEIGQRFAGCRAAAAEAGLDAPVAMSARFAADMAEADIARHLDSHIGQIDGIVAASDVIAMVTLRLLADRSISVPDDIAVVGYDDLPLATQTVPRLTTIRQDLQAGAAAMIDLLFRRLNGEDAPALVMPPQLVVRDSA